MWRVPLELGLAPAPPLEKMGVVYACSDRGKLSWLDASDGHELGRYQVTAGARVMTPIAVDDESVCYVSALDGSLTAVRLRR